MSIEISNVVVDICAMIISSSLGVSIKEIRNVFNKDKLEESKKTEISSSIDVVSKKLEESKDIIDNALLEIEKQKKLYEQMKREADISQQIATMNSEQVEALNLLLENTLNRQEKKAFPINLLINLFFCVLSALLGFWLGKIF